MCRTCLVDRCSVLEGQRCGVRLAVRLSVELSTGIQATASRVKVHLLIGCRLEPGKIQLSWKPEYKSTCLGAV
jgi:hypothetical protein